MAKGKAGSRIILQLDPRMALEVIILNRLERIPKARRQEWLRGLLVQGFRAECQTLQRVPDEPVSSPVTGFSSWLLGSTQKSAAPLEKPREKPIESRATLGSGKPFAALGKVIG